VTSSVVGVKENRRRDRRFSEVNNQIPNKDFAKSAPPGAKRPSQECESKNPPEKNYVITEWTMAIVSIRPQGTVDFFQRRSRPVKLDAMSANHHGLIL
jgi:hypothetical protein